MKSTKSHYKRTLKNQLYFYVEAMIIMDTEIKTIPFILIQKKKYLGINLTKPAQAYMLKEIQEELNK
jgi:hypothetical protein